MRPGRHSGDWWPGHWHVSSTPEVKGGHKPCLCEGVAGLRPATLSQKYGLYCFLAPKRVLSCHPSVGFVMNVVSDESGFDESVSDESGL